MDHTMHHMDMDHGGHGGMDMGPKCDMHMLWNTQIIDTCVVFRSWHISSTTTFLLSFIAIVLLGVAYEWLRRAQTILDIRIARSIAKGKTSVTGGRDSPTEDAPLNPRLFKQPLVANLSTNDRIARAALYGASVFLSFFLMLVFMTYNAYLILAVVLGAAVGHYVFGGQMNAEAVLVNAGGTGKGMACH